MTSLAEPIEGIEPVAPASSLLTVARPLRSGVNWAGGLAQEPGECQRAYSWAICNTGEEDPDDPGTSTKELSRDTPAQTFRPWPVYLPEGCEDYTALDSEEYDGRAATALGAYTAYAISAELESGEFTSNPHLADGTDGTRLLESGSSFAPHVAISKLIESRLTAGIAGFHMLHIPMATLPLLVEKQLVIPSGGGRLQTTGGIAVSVGPGYTGAPLTTGWPVIADSVYIYMTGMVEWAASPVEPLVTGQGQFRRTNLTHAWAERMVIYRYSDCFVRAIAMDTTGA